MKLKKSILKYVFPKAPVEIRLALIRLELELSPEDLVTALFVLTHDKDLEVAKEASKGFPNLPEKTVMRALVKELQPEVIKYIAEEFPLSEKVLDLLALNEGADGKIFEGIAKTSSLEALEIFVENARMLRTPKVLKALEGNPNITEEVMDRARKNRVAMGIKEEVEAETPESPNKEKDDEDEGESLNLYQLVQSMSVGDKVKLALTGNKEARTLLLKQSNKVISRSVVRNPSITEDEIVKITQNRSVSDEIIREVARNDEWLKNYVIRRGLVFNPKTPIQISMRLLPKLNKKDVATLAKSKGVPNVLAASAKKLSNRKNS